MATDIPVYDTVPTERVASDTVRVGDSLYSLTVLMVLTYSLAQRLYCLNQTILWVTLVLLVWDISHQK